MRNNYEYTKALAHWAVDLDARFVYASSAATYGGLEDGSLRRNRTAQPAAAQHVRLFEASLRPLRPAHGTGEQIVGLKYFNVFGPNEDHKGDMRSIVSRPRADSRDGRGQALQELSAASFATAKQQRDFIYVKDAVEMTHRTSRSPTLTGLVNIGSGNAQTWLDLVRPIFAALGLPERSTFIEMPETLRPKYQYSTCATIDRLRASGYTSPDRRRSTPPCAITSRTIWCPGRLLDPAPQSRTPQLR